ncbi:MAG: hypothetical protein V1754_05535, partial [Pseudomonadota bacterium]
LKASYIWRGDLHASLLLKPKELLETKNSRRTYVFVVLRKNLEKHQFCPDPKLIENRASFMIAALNLRLRHAFANGNMQIHGGWVDPYAKGCLAPTASGNKPDGC